MAKKRRRRRVRDLIDRQLARWLATHGLQTLIERGDVPYVVRLLIDRGLVPRQDPPAQARQVVRLMDAIAVIAAIATVSHDMQRVIDAQGPADLPPDLRRALAVLGVLEAPPEPRLTDFLPLANPDEEAAIAAEYQADVGSDAACWSRSRTETVPISALRVSTVEAEADWAELSEEDLGTQQQQFQAGGWAAFERLPWGIRVGDHVVIANGHAEIVAALRAGATEVVMRVA